MSIGISFAARVRQKEDLVRAVQESAALRDYEVDVGENSLRVLLCPMGALTIEWEQVSGEPAEGESAEGEPAEEKLAEGEWLVSGECCTTPAGAGLHKAVIDLLDDIKARALKSISVDDGTGYYDHRDFERMKREHFYPWLGALVKLCREEMEPKGYRNISFCWDLDQYQPEEVPGTVISPMGRFSIQALAENVEQKGLSWFADRFFLWDGQERDARYYRNVAVNLLWEHCFFVPSSRSGEDRECHRRILDFLEKAAGMDGSLPLPLTAYREVCALAGREPAIPSSAPELETEFPIGYRKGLVIYGYDNLRLTLPGRYRYEWEEYEDGEGCDCFSDSSSNSQVWRINQYCRRDGDAEFTEHISAEKDLEYRAMKKGEACWGWREASEDGTSFYLVTCEAISGPNLFVITVAYDRQEERDLIYELLRKLNAVREEPGG